MSSRARGQPEVASGRLAALEEFSQREPGGGVNFETLMGLLGGRPCVIGADCW